MDEENTRRGIRNLVQTCRIRPISDRSPQGAACWSALTQVIRVLGVELGVAVTAARSHTTRAGTQGSIMLHQNCVRTDLSTVRQESGAWLHNAGCRQGAEFATRHNRVSMKRRCL